MKEKFVKDLSFRDSVEEIFLIKYISLNAAKDGKEYLNVVLSDKTGDLEGRKWNDVHDITSQISRGDIVKVFGKVNQFQGRLQIVISEIMKVSDEDVNMQEFVMSSDERPDVMMNQLKAIVAGLDDVYIKELLEQMINDPELERRLKIWPAGKTIHHAFQGGLLEHILSCTQLAVDLSQRYKVNTNYVVAGAVIHDLCKVYELSDGPVVDYTEEGKLVGHLVKGVELIDRYCSRIKNFPYSTKLHLKHIVVSHHGELEYGSPKLPQTSEAMLVHLIDYMDSKMGSFALVKKTDTTPGHWSGVIKYLDRVIYKDELPHHSEFIQDQQLKEPQDQSEDQSHPRTPLAKQENKSEKKKNHWDNKEIKNNKMAELLKNIKVEE